MRYLLDTNICIYIAKRRPPAALMRLEALQPGDAVMSVVTCFELVYGAWNSDKVHENLAIIDQIRALIPVQPLTDKAAGHYGKIRNALSRSGRPIGPLDLVIAAHALSLDLTLVSNNTLEFSRIDGLRIENWAE
jgi:tRNA(fMet)-specific endonuclease VapC